MSGQRITAGQTSSEAPKTDSADGQAFIAEMVARARVAQKIAATWSQERVDEVCVAVGWSVYNDENIRKLAELAVAETGMGRVEDKITKHKLKVIGVLRDFRGVRTVGLMEEDPARGLRKYAKPVGVVGLWRLSRTQLLPPLPMAFRFSKERTPSSSPRIPRQKNPLPLRAPSCAKPCKKSKLRRTLSRS